MFISIEPVDITVTAFDQVYRNQANGSVIRLQRLKSGHESLEQLF